MSKTRTVMSTADHQRQICDYYTKDEAVILKELCSAIPFSRADRADIVKEAVSMVRSVRADKSSISVFDKLLQEYGLSSQEGVQLMRLAEALVRTPDFDTRRLLIRDKIGPGDWASHAGRSDAFLVNQATNGMRLSKGWVCATGGTNSVGVISKLGDRVLDGVLGQVMKTMGRHFVLGRNISEAIRRSAKSKDVAFSYDMLGEAARTEEDAKKYFADYLNAVELLANGSVQTRDNSQRSGLSVKLSALHPRFEYARKDACLPVITERMQTLCAVAAKAGLWINIDAEECDRTELTLEVFEALLGDMSLGQWSGLGIVVQAYQRRAIPIIDYIQHLARRADRRVAVRLVKGAYWDGEIKRAQQLGLPDYPVFTRKENTDVSYIACANRLLDAGDVIFPQFATHNAHTAVAIARLAGNHAYEFQRLHGMGEQLHRCLSEEYGVVSRVYAPVGRHRELLPYLVRRLLENGANSSFVNQMYDDDITPGDVATDPIELVGSNEQVSHPAIVRPRKILQPERDLAAGQDLTQSTIVETFEDVVREPVLHTAASIVDGVETGHRTEQVFSPQVPTQLVGRIMCVGEGDVAVAVAAARNSSWCSQSTPQHRASVLRRAADELECNVAEFARLCVWEAGKTVPDAIDEIREAVDFCRYYAAQATLDHMGSREPLGVVACISPWNFPLAIFIGQIAAALSVGNTVVAKPPAQTPLIAHKAIQLLHRAGVSTDALHLLLGDGAELGNALVRHPGVSGVCFTGSTATAKIIATNLAETGRLGAPFIAETGGINAMIVDSTSLLEQAVQDTIDSAFQSAGQRCSACRIVCVQSDIADDFRTMLTGAMATLKVGDPKRLSTDCGPIIDLPSKEKIDAYVERHRRRGSVIAECKLPESEGYYVSPCLIKVDAVSEVNEEIFGPVLHFVTFEAGKLDNLLEKINALGYGLTMGLHTRIDATVDHVSNRAHVGNLYVNRNQIGAVVGVQPFGGEGMSGTGPKAGGPNYLERLSKARCSPLQSCFSEQLIPNEGDVEPEQSTIVQTVARARKATLETSVEKFDVFCETVEDNFGDTVLSTWVNDLNSQTKDRCRPKMLAGPTGEQNTLRGVPRGVLLALASAPETLAQQVFKCLITGNACLVVRRAETVDTFRALKQMSRSSGLPEDLLSLVEEEHIATLIRSNIDGILVESDELKRYEKQIAARLGALLPVLSSRSDISHFLVERTLTINTAAAGGNTTLFAKL